MTYQVFDCLSDTEISRHDSKAEADEICAIHGGADACIHVFEVEEKSEEKEYSGDLFS